MRYAWVMMPFGTIPGSHPRRGPERVGRCVDGDPERDAAGDDELGLPTGGDAVSVPCPQLAQVPR